MINLIFIVILALGCSALIVWGCKTLPGEKWQILATVPAQKRQHTDSWQGINFTYYGFFNACACLTAILLFIILMGSLQVTPGVILLTAFLLLALCVPAARIVAGVVEKKKYTFTVGGASFVGIIAAPLIIYLINGISGLWFAGAIPVMPTLAAMVIAYAIGEGLGRLSCVSFGCCYGRSLASCHPFLRGLFARHHFIFSGTTKKAVYESNLGGIPLVPIQSITCAIYTLTALIGIILFLNGYYRTAFLGCLIITQVWRVISEIFRADFRGFSRISTYQLMSLGGSFYGLALAWLLPTGPSANADILLGLTILWNPLTLIILQMIWLTIFWFTGKSMVTNAVIAFDVVRENI